MSDSWHTLLRRQLKRHFGDPTAVPDEWLAFLSAINDAYVQSDHDRTMIERSLDLSSAELGQANAEMRQAVTALREAQVELETRVAARTQELTLANETLRETLVEQRSLEARLRQAQKMEAIGRLAGGIAHDFNNLLTVVFGRVEVLLEENPDDEARASIAEIQQAAESAAALTHQLLAFSRQQRLTPTILDINDLVQTTNVLLRRLIGEDIDLVTSLDRSVGTVCADAGQLQQVLLNLGANAREAMPHGGRLTISTSARVVPEGQPVPEVGLRPGSYVVLTVSDTGVGMDADAKAHIFEPFFSTKPLHQGTGLGLATAYGIVKQSDGYIDVSSEPGQGSTFRVLLPKAAAPATQVAAPGRAAPRGAGLILVAEDQDAVRRVICSGLRRAGFTVLEADGGLSALAIAAPLPHLDLLLTDVVMPQMNGGALAKELVRLRPALRVIYMTGYIDDVNVMREIRGHGSTVMQKPFTADALVQTIHTVLAAPAPSAP